MSEQDLDHHPEPRDWHSPPGAVPAARPFPSEPAQGRYVHTDQGTVMVDANGGHFLVDTPPRPVDPVVSLASITAKIAAALVLVALIWWVSPMISAPYTIVLAVVAGGPLLVSAGIQATAQVRQALRIPTRAQRRATRAIDAAVRESAPFLQTLDVEGAERAPGEHDTPGAEATGVAESMTAPAATTLDDTRHRTALSLRREQRTNFELGVYRSAMEAVIEAAGKPATTVDVLGAEIEAALDATGGEWNRWRLPEVDTVRTGLRTIATECKTAGEFAIAAEAILRAAPETATAIAQQRNVSVASL